MYKLISLHVLILKEFFDAVIEEVLFETRISIFLILILNDEIPSLLHLLPFKKHMDLFQFPCDLDILLTTGLLLLPEELKLFQQLQSQLLQNILFLLDGALRIIWFPLIVNEVVVLQVKQLHFEVHMELLQVLHEVVIASTDGLLQVSDELKLLQRVL